MVTERQNIIRTLSKGEFEGKIVFTGIGLHPDG